MRSLVYLVTLTIVTLSTHSFASHTFPKSWHRHRHVARDSSSSSNTSPAPRIGLYKGQMCRIRPNDHTGQYGLPTTASQSSDAPLPTLVVPPAQVSPSVPLYPTLDDNVNIFSLDNLVPKSNHRLYYQSNDTSAPTKRLWTVIDFKYPTVAIDHSAYIGSVTCSSDTSMSLGFNVIEADTIYGAWSTNLPMILSGHTVEGCDPVHQDGPARFWAVVTAITQVDDSTLQFTYNMQGLLDVSADVVFHIGHPDGINGPARSGNSGSFTAGTHSTGSSGSSSSEYGPGGSSSSGSGASGSSSGSGSTNGNGFSSGSGSSAGNGYSSGSGSSGENSYSSGSGSSSGNSASSGSGLSSVNNGYSSDDSGSGSSSPSGQNGNDDGYSASSGSFSSSASGSASAFESIVITVSSSSSSASASSTSASSGSSSATGSISASLTSSETLSRTATSTGTYPTDSVSATPTSQDPLDETFDLVLDSLLGHWPYVTFGYLRSVFPNVTFFSSADNGSTTTSSTASSSPTDSVTVNALRRREIAGRTIQKRDFWGWVSDTWNSVTTVVTNTFNAVADGFEQIGQGLEDFGNALIDAATNYVQTVIDVAGDLAKGDFGAVLSDIGAGIIGNLESLGEAAIGLGEVALGAAEVGWAAATFPSNLAAAVIPGVDLSLEDTDWEFAFPPENFLPTTDSIFGDGYLIFQYNKSSSITSGEEKRSIRGSIDDTDDEGSGSSADLLGLTRRETKIAGTGGIKIFCIDCRLKAEFDARGSVHYTPPAFLTDAKLKLTGPMSLHVEIGFELFAQLSATFEKTIVEIPLIEPEIATEGLTIGPTFQMRTEVSFIYEADGYVGIGYDIEWDDDFTVTIDFSNPTESSGDNLSPKSTTPIFNVGAGLSFTAEAGVLFGVPVGMECFEKKYEVGPFFKMAVGAQLVWAVEEYVEDDPSIHQSITTLGDNLLSGRTIAASLPEATDSPTPTRDTLDPVMTPPPEKRDLSCQGLSVGIVAKDVAFFSALSQTYAVYNATSTLAYWCQTGVPTSTDYSGDATLTSVSVTVPTQTAVACGGLSGSTSYTTNEQSRYNIACGTNYAGNEIESVSVSSFKKCMQQCSNYNVALASSDYGVLCMGVSFDGTTCSLKSQMSSTPTTDSTSNSGILVKDGRCANGAQLFTSLVNSATYNFVCGVDYPGNDLTSYEGISGLPGCLDQCSTYNANVQTTTCTTYTGIMALTFVGQTSVFAVLGKTASSVWQTTSDTSQALHVQFTDCQDGKPFNIVPLDASWPSGSSFPYLGLVQSRVSPTSVMAPGSINFLEIVGSQSTPQGSGPLLVDNGEKQTNPYPYYYPNQQTTWPSETAVWTYNPSSGLITAYWTNTDGSTYPMYSQIYYSSLYFAGDTSTRKSSFSADMIPVDLHFIVGSSSSTATPDNGCVGVSYSPLSGTCYLKSSMTNPTSSTQVDSATGSTGKQRRGSIHRRDDTSTAADSTTISTPDATTSSSTSSLFSFGIPADGSNAGFSFDLSGMDNLTTLPDYTNLNQVPYVNVTVPSAVNVAPTATSTAPTSTATANSTSNDYSYALLSSHDGQYFAYTSEAGNIFLTPAPVGLDSSSSNTASRKRSSDPAAVNRTNNLFVLSQSGAMTFDYQARLFFLYSDEINSHGVSRLRCHGQADTPYTSIAVTFVPVSKFGSSPTIDSLVAVTTRLDRFFIAGCMYKANHDVIKLFLVRDISGLDFLMSNDAIDTITGGEIETCQLVGMKTVAI